MRARLLICACLLACASLLSSCNKPDNGVEDGLEFIWFTISGTVVDKSGTPIEGIKIIAESASSVITGADGKFTIDGGSMPSDYAVITLADSNTEQKRYITKMVTVEIVKYKDGQGWNKGYYKNKEELTVTMDEEFAVIPPTSDIE